MFAGGWSGMGVIDDLDRGVMDRFLVAPTSRGAIMLGRVTPQVLTILIQTLIIVGLALLVGGRFAGGVGRRRHADRRLDPAVDRLRLAVERRRPAAAQGGVGDRRRST